MKQQSLQDPAAERAVLSGICQYGHTALVDVDDIITGGTFVHESNQIIYKCLKKVLDNSDQVDISSILSSATELNFYEALQSKKELEYIRSIFTFPIHLENVRKHALKIRKLEFCREIQSKIKQAYTDLSEVSGEETIDEILSIAEAPIFELSSSANRGDDSRPVSLGNDIEEYLTYLEENPSEMMGLSSGFARYDTAIGGGFRRKCVDLVAARPKVGKSMFGDNVAMHISGELGMPVLMLDTEMSKEDHLNRIISNLSGITINNIATGSFSKSAIEKEKVYNCTEKLKDLPYDYISIAGKPFEETLSIMRRWITQKVGFDENGRTNDCMIIYDYLKLMTSDSISSSLQEFQVLGFQITSLHNFCVQYDCPCLSFVQLNRDGITKESTDVVSGSDRLIWLCTSFSIFKNKSEEEVAEDGEENGNRKLIPLVSRHGAGLADGDYINMSMIGEVGKILEGVTRNELRKNSKQDSQGFIVENDDNEKIPFESE
jgi:replicative DNA helicase